ncbi:MAG: 3',5'-cyclic-nucleotide phosphodiesterase [Sulfuricellaceae bacterium]|nr:3',5'-cyclic-nucleotide phosphodiesterase [Sulfuricellaceae bacterium]
MKLEILGCSGGVGGGLRTTSMRLDGDVLIDAGTGVCDLSIEDMARIDHIFITHSHLDHIACIPLLIDTVAHLRDRPLVLYGLAETMRILREHVFNWKIWPDFSVIPTSEKPSLRFQAVALGETVDLAGRKITALPANHVVPAVGYQLDSGSASLVFSGDTAVNDALWDVVNRIDNLRYLIIETAYSNAEKDLADLSKHLCPITLAAELKKLHRSAEVYISHLKPGESAQIMKEIEGYSLISAPRMLQARQAFIF